MPLKDNELNEARGRLLRMVLDTVQTFETIEKAADALYGDRAPEMRAAIRECLDDFLGGAQGHPEAVIYRTPPSNLENAGLYGAQLNLKERQVTEVNRTLRGRLLGGLLPAFRGTFQKWVDVINNFLGSLASATGVGEALKELKDCLRDELPEG